MFLLSFMHWVHETVFQSLSAHESESLLEFMLVQTQSLSCMVRLVPLLPFNPFSTIGPPEGPHEARGKAQGSIWVQITLWSLHTNAGSLTGK